MRWCAKKEKKNKSGNPMTRKEKKKKEKFVSRMARKESSQRSMWKGKDVVSSLEIGCASYFYPIMLCCPA